MLAATELVVSNGKMIGGVVRFSSCFTRFVILAGLHFNIDKLSVVKDDWPE